MKKEVKEVKVYPKQYVLTKDIVIPKGTVLDNVEGQKMYFGEGMYEAQGFGPEPMFVFIDDDVLYDNKKFMKEVK